VRGNVDTAAWARKLPETEVLETAGFSIYVLHDLAQLDLKPEAAGFSVVIYGHSHVPRQETMNGVLYFNPGSAGPRRFKLPVTVGRLIVAGHIITKQIVTRHTGTEEIEASKTEASKTEASNPAAGKVRGEIVTIFD
jgi:uncharacterized protein